MSKKVNFLPGYSAARVTPLNGLSQPGNNDAYSYHDNTQVTTGAHHTPLNPGIKTSHKNMLQPVSRPGSILTEKCALAYTESSDAMNTNKLYTASVYDSNLPSTGVPVLCSSLNPGETSQVCLPDGTVPILCMGQEPTGEAGGIAASSFGGYGVGGAGMAPSWIAVPRSEASQDIVNMGTAGCHGPNPTRHYSTDPYKYVKTTNYDGSNSHPGARLGGVSS